MTLKIKGELEIDRERGVIYFHSEHGYTALRICNLPAPIPTTTAGNGLDITYGVGCSWKGVCGNFQPNYDQKKKCAKCGHEAIIKPIKVLEGMEALYSSDLDFCNKCGEAW